MGVEERLLGRQPLAALVGEARERLGADHLAAVEVDDRLQRDVKAVAVDQPRDAVLHRFAAAAVEVRDLLLAASALALDLEPAAELDLELAQPVGDRDEADYETDGGDRELAGAQRQARPPRVLVRLRGEEVGEG